MSDETTAVIDDENDDAQAGAEAAQESDDTDA